MNNLNYKDGRSQKTEKNPRWKGKTASYTAKHQYLTRNHGNPKYCESCLTDGHKEKDGRWSIQWAKKDGHEYTHNVDDYHGLCRRCHGKYDFTEEKREHLIKIAKEQKGSNSQVKSVIAKDRPRDGKGKFISLNKK